MILAKNIGKKSRICGTFFVLAILASCSKQEWVKMKGNAIGTTYHIQYENTGTSEFSEAEMDSAIQWMNHALSTYQKNSLITSFNTNDNSMWRDKEQLKYFEADMRHLINMLVLSAQIYESSYHAFDPTAERVFELWAKAKDSRQIPDSASIAEAMKHKGFKSIKKDPNGFPFKKDTLLKLNFNAVAKGYLVDEIADMLLAKGIENFMVEIGGELSVHGKNPAGEDWKLGVNTPSASSNINDVFEAITISDESMATSGNYRNFFESEGKIIGHTIDPRTGWPTNNNLRSATVIHRFSAVADAYATACMVLGYDSAKLMIEQDTNLRAYFIIEEDSGLKGIHIE